MKKRLLSVLLSVTMLFGVVALTGCNGDNNGNDGTPTTTGATGDGTPNGDVTGGDATTGGGDDGPPEAETEQEIAARVFRELQGGEPGDRTVVNFYTFTTETASLLLPRFLEANPDFAERFFINIEIAADAGPHIMAVNQRLGNADGPHIFVADVDYAMAFAALDGTASIAELGIEINESEFYDYVLDIMRRGDDIMGLSHQAAPGGMIYRADIAQEVLGINSEAEMQALVSTWDGFLEVAAQIVEETDLAMLYGADELKRNFLNTRTQGWVVQDEEGRDVFNICEDTINEFIRVTGEIRDMEGLRTNGTGQWSDEWQAARRDNDDSVFAYFGSTWYLHWIHRPHVRNETDGELGEDNTYGQWGMVPGPASFFWGGTYWFGSKVAAEDEELAEAVRRIIEFFCVDDEAIEAFAFATGDFVAKRSVVNRIKNDARFNNPLFLFNTNHYQVFAEIADIIDITNNVTRFDASMDDIFSNFITSVFADNTAVGTAMENMRNEVRANITAIDVP
jgi:hypothetical protein